MSCIQDIFKNLCYDIASLLLGGCCMRKVELRMNEENKYLIIKKLVETNGNKNRAAIKLDVLSELSIDSSLNIKNMVKLLLFMATEAELLLPLYLSISKTGLSNFISIIIVTLILLISVKSFMMISMLKLVIRLLTSGLEMKISFPLKPERKRERY